MRIRPIQTENLGTDREQIERTHRKESLKVLTPEECAVVVGGSASLPLPPLPPGGEIATPFPYLG